MIASYFDRCKKNIGNLFGNLNLNNFAVTKINKNFTFDLLTFTLKQFLPDEICL